MIKLCKLVNILPYFFFGGMENMSPVTMNLDPFNFLCVNISANVIPFVYYKTGFAMLHCLMCKHRPKKACAYDQIIIFFHKKNPLSFESL